MVLALGVRFARSAARWWSGASLVVLAAGGCHARATPAEAKAQDGVAPRGAASAPRKTPAPVATTSTAPESPPTPTSDRPDPIADSMVLAGGVCIDTYEAHLLERTATGYALHPPHLRPAEGVEYYARSQPGVRPQAYISRVEAARACENAGERLCSVDEWYSACRGASRTTYPYGGVFERGRCNVGKPHLLTLHFGGDPQAWKYEEHFNSPLLDQLAGYLEPAGHYPGCVSSYGVYDMVGNLHEWVADPVGTALGTKLPLQDGIRRRLRANAGKGVFMGGFFSTTSEHGRGCDFVTIAHEPKYHDYSTGFRCCRDPRPVGESAKCSGDDPSF